jgi:DNA topoisomerase-3
VPKLTQGQELTVDTVDIEVKQTKPPARYNEGALIKAIGYIFVKTVVECHGSCGG